VFDTPPGVTGATRWRRRQDTGTGPNAQAPTLPRDASGLADLPVWRWSYRIACRVAGADRGTADSHFDGGERAAHQVARIAERLHLQGVNLEMGWIWPVSAAFRRCRDGKDQSVCPSDRTAFSRSVTVCERASVSATA